MRPESTQTRKLRDGWFPWPKLLLLLCDMDMGLKRSMDGADVKDVEALVLGMHGGNRSPPGVTQKSYIVVQVMQRRPRSS